MIDTIFGCISYTATIAWWRLSLYNIAVYSKRLSISVSINRFLFARGSFMRNLCAAIACCLALAFVAQADTLRVHVVGVTDGDTIRVVNADGQMEKIRLSGIDAPEKRQAYGARAKQFTADAVTGEDVTLVTHGHDRYGRIIADVYRGDGTSLNEALVRDGLAWWYWKYSRDERLRDLELQARKRRVGLWHDEVPQPPWEYRHGHARRS
jgi:micrococcal nuclease